MTTFHLNKPCSFCGYVGNDFGRDASQEDGFTRYCKPCTRVKTAKAAKRKALLVKAWHNSPEYVPGTVAPDAWRVANGFSLQRGRTPAPGALDAWGTTQEEYEKMAYGDPNAVKPANPNLPVA